jgi:hypothetical protein
VVSAVEDAIKAITAGKPAGVNAFPPGLAQRGFADPHSS